MSEYMAYVMYLQQLQIDRQAGWVGMRYLGTYLLLTYGSFDALWIYFLCIEEDDASVTRFRCALGSFSIMTNSYNVFRKSQNCPSSEELLSYQAGNLEMARTGEIIGHLNYCDFCAAEVEFYQHFPPIETPKEFSEIPAPLYELAAALLGDKDRGGSTLNDLLRSRGMALDNA